MIVVGARGNSATLANFIYKIWYDTSFTLPSISSFNLGSNDFSEHRFYRFDSIIELSSSKIILPSQSNTGSCDIWLHILNVVGTLSYLNSQVVSTSTDTGNTFFSILSMFMFDDTNNDNKKIILTGTRPTTNSTYIKIIDVNINTNSIIVLNTVYITSPGLSGRFLARKYQNDKIIIIRNKISIIQINNDNSITTLLDNFTWSVVIA